MMCPVCGKEVLFPHRKYCCLVCARKARKDKEKAERNQAVKDRARVSKIDIKRRSCLVCGKEFVSEGAWNRQCSRCKNSPVVYGRILDKPSRSSVGGFVSSYDEEY